MSGVRAEGRRFVMIVPRCLVLEQRIDGFVMNVPRCLVLEQRVDGL